MDALRSRLGDRLRRNVPLAPLTTFKVGGAAEFLADIESEDELRATVTAAAAAGLPVTVLGGGSNVLIADAGIKGLVLRLHLTAISQPQSDRVRAESGATMNGLVRWTIGRGLAALEAWAGTPGTVGGAIFGNAHYGGRNIGDLVESARVVTPAGDLVTVAREQMGFAYDTSRLKATGELVVWAEFGVSPGEPEALRAIARQSLAHRKRTQPLSSQSAGCVFQNPDPARDRIPAGIPASAGALIDRAGLKGHRIGGAMISPVHANFFVNAGNATATDIADLIDLAKRTVRERFGVELLEEIVRLG